MTHVVYHYSKEKYSTSYNDLDQLHEAVIRDLENVTKQIQSRIPNIKVCWTKKNGLGCVFTDLEESKLGSKPPKNSLYFNGQLIGKGETALFDEIQNKCEYLLLTNTLTKRMSDEFFLNNGEKVAVVNIDQFKEIMDTKSNLQSVVKIILRSDPPIDILMLLEKLLRQVQDEDVKIIMEKLERLFYRFKIEENKDVQLIIRIITHLIDNLQVENPEILKKIP